MNEVLNAEFDFTLPPQKAIEHLQTKKILQSNQLNFIVDEKLLQINKAKAFHLANINCLNILQAVKHEVEKGLTDGISFSQFKNNLFEKIDKKSFSEKRLNTIFRTNINSSYQAGRFSALKGNIDNRPYWQYQAILDDRVRDNHAGVHNKIFRHDDAFWTHFYPPNGYNCRCMVVALSEKDIKRKGLAIGKTLEENLEHHPANLKNPHQRVWSYKDRTTGAKIKPDGGFDYPSQLFLYSPKLDEYDTELAKLYVERELQGATFAFVYDDIKSKLSQISKIGWTSEENKIRSNLSINANFASGIATEGLQNALNAKTKTIWLSDDTMIKNIRHHPEIDLKFYQMLPILYEHIDVKSTKQSGNNITCFANFESKRYRLTFKILETEIFLLSFLKIK